MKTSRHIRFHYGLLAAAVLLILGLINAPVHAVVSCSCDAVSCQYKDCAGYHVLIKPHDKITQTRNPSYTPGSSGDEQNNILDVTNVIVGTQNDTDQPMCPVTDHPGASISENRTISVGGTASVEYTSSAELSYGVVSGSIGYTLGFQVTGSYTVEQGSTISHSIDYGPYTLPAHSRSEYSVKLYKKTCSVSVTQEKRVAHLGNCATCSVRTGPIGSWGSESGNANGHKYTSIVVAFQGIVSI